MISTAPVAVAAAAPGSPVAKAAAFIDAARSAAADGLTWAEFGDLLVSLLRLLTSTYDDIRSLSGPQKKGLVLDAVAGLFDAVADKCVPAMAWPLWVVARPAVRSLVVAIAAGAIEQVLPLVRG